MKKKGFLDFINRVIWLTIGIFIIIILGKNQIEPFIVSYFPQLKESQNNNKIEETGEAQYYNHAGQRY